MIDKERRKTIARVEEISRLLVRTLYLADDDDASSRVDPGGYFLLYGGLSQRECTAEPRLVFGLRMPGVLYCHGRSICLLLGSVLR